VADYERYLCEACFPERHGNQADQDMGEETRAPATLLARRLSHEQRLKLNKQFVAELDQIGVAPAPQATSKLSTLIECMVLTSKTVSELSVRLKSLDLSCRAVYLASLSNFFYPEIEIIEWPFRGCSIAKNGTRVSAVPAFCVTDYASNTSYAQVCTNISMNSLSPQTWGFRIPRFDSMFKNSKS
jgi:hypothetical protein